MVSMHTVRLIKYAIKIKCHRKRNFQHYLRPNVNIKFNAQTRSLAHTHTNKVHKWSDNCNICIHFSFRLTYYRVCFPFINAGFRMPDELAKSDALNVGPTHHHTFFGKYLLCTQKVFTFNQQILRAHKCAKGK